MKMRLLLTVFSFCFVSFLWANDEKVLYDAVLKNIHNDVSNSEISRSIHKSTLYTLVLKNRRCLQDSYLLRLLDDGRVNGLNYKIRDEKFDLKCKVADIDQGKLNTNSVVRLCDWSQYGEYNFNLFEMTNYKYEYIVLVRVEFTEIKIQDNFAVVVALVKVGNGSIRAGNAYLFEFEKGSYWQLKNKFLVE